MSNQTKNTLLLTLTALIWGFSFIAQSMGATIGAFTFLASRSWIGVVVLLPVLYGADRLRAARGEAHGWPTAKADRLLMLRGGLSCGFFLFVASAAQQTAMTLNASTAKAGFITAMYVVLVPVVGGLFGKKTGGQIWFCVAVSVVGLYLLCMTNGLESVEASDLLLLLCAFLFTFQILSVDHFSPQMDCIRLSFLQFVVTAVLATVGALLFETPVFADIVACAGPILYCGVLSTGVAYTLQIIAQKDLKPAIASITMCLESVFAALGGWLILQQVLTPREAAGCALIFFAVVFAQVPVQWRKASAGVGASAGASVSASSSVSTSSSVSGQAPNPAE